MMPKINDIDRERAARIAHLFGGNGLSMQQSIDLATVVFAESREDPEGLTAPLKGWLEDGRALKIAREGLTLAETSV